MPGHEGGLGIIGWALRGSQRFSMVGAQPFGETVRVVGPVRCTDAEVGGNSESAPAKELVTPRAIPGRPSFIGKDLPGYLSSAGPRPETFKANLCPLIRCVKTVI
jgi:hypothetical protein